VNHKVDDEWRKRDGGLGNGTGMMRLGMGLDACIICEAGIPGRSFMFLDNYQFHLLTFMQLVLIVGAPVKC
jgi:hypothetical protein